MSETTQKILYLVVWAAAILFLVILQWLTANNNYRD